MYNPFSLKNKTILVTGASSGIGRAVAIECSKLAAKVALNGRDNARLAETFESLEGQGHVIIPADLTDSEAIEMLVDQIPIIDGLVLCAGRGMVAPMKSATKERLNTVFEVNFFSIVELMRLLLKKKKINEGSSIVFVSSIGGVQSITIGNGMYGASKAALNSAMKFYALELASKKIRVNSVNPGMVNTKLIQGGAVSEEQQAADMQKYPLKRYGEPIDIAHGIIYLLSDASSWVTGHSLVIDGGYTI